MIENRWVLFLIYFIGMLALHLLLFPKSSQSIAEYLFTAFLSAGLFAYSYKYFKRLLSYVIQKIVPLIPGTKPKNK